MRLLARRGLLDSHRGVKGGYRLARPSSTISLAQVIRALEGPVGLTVCAESPGLCAHEPLCTVRRPWQRINQVIFSALDTIMLSEMGRTPLPMVPPQQLDLRSHA
jgi:Rrf2 family protein